MPRDTGTLGLMFVAVHNIQRIDGTTMGCVGPKSVIEVREGMTFLDLSDKSST